MKKGPFILRALLKKAQGELTYWDGCAFMSMSPTAEYCTLPENARRFDTLEEAERGIVEWVMRYPRVAGEVEIVDLNHAWGPK